MKFGVYVALPKRNINAKYEIEIHVYSDVTPFYKIRQFPFLIFFVKRSPNRVTVIPTDLNEIWHTRSTP